MWRYRTDPVDTLSKSSTSKALHLTTDYRGFCLRTSMCIHPQTSEDRVNLNKMYFHIPMSSINHKTILIHPGSFVNKKALLSFTSLRFRHGIYLQGILRPFHIRFCLRWFSIAASKPRIVSSGRSSRLRVGLERSGSARSKSIPVSTSRALDMIGNALMIFPSLSLC